MRLPTLSAGAIRVPRERRGHEGAAIPSIGGAGVAVASGLYDRADDCYWNCRRECAYNDPFCAHNCRCECYGIPGETCLQM
jgi:hypothetical protein